MKETASSVHREKLLNENQRPIWIIIFAILLASIAIRTKGQEIPSADPDRYTTIQVGDQIRVVERASAKRRSIDGLSSRPNNSRAAARNRVDYVFMTAELGQFDADEDPDGWIAKVMLFNNDDQAVVGIPGLQNASARFELIPQVPTHEFTGYVKADAKPIVWNKPLKFSADGWATIRLPLKNRIPPLVGWPETSHPAVGRVGGFYSPRRGIIRHTTPDFQARTAVTDVRRRGGALYAMGTAAFAQMKVRVSVPTAGAFDAATPVVMRPSVLVDTRWPYQ